MMHCGELLHRKLSDQKSTVKSKESCKVLSAASQDGCDGNTVFTL